MGSYTTLTIDEYPVYSSKSYVSDISYIFCESDKKIFNRNIKDRNIIVWGNSNDEDIEIAYEYQTTVGIAIERLEIMGYSLNKAQEDFTKSKNKLIEELTSFLEYPDTAFMNKYYKYEIKLLENSDFNDFIKAFIEIRTKKVPNYKTDKDYNLSNISKYLIDDGWFLNYPCSEFGFYYRAFLGSCNKDSLVIQDVTEVINAGYYKPEDEIINNLIESQEKITILTEGTSDINIISKSMQLLHPHLFNYYNFKDFKISNASGSANQLTLEIKSLIAINHKNKVIALFDNDGEGLTQINLLKKINIPKNFVIYTYPDLPLLESYPTSNNKFENVNGIAGSIEMCLGKDILQEEGKFISIELNHHKIAHGKIMSKNNLQKQYYKKIKNCKKDSNMIEEFDWSEMKLLLNKIFQAFKT
ncbi:HEPN/Toprim-associated domain-containing protein [Sulfurimonas sp.]|uniref:HEPN/Toprim-associated domain-containing protein n=1 Tax=Sulfurimonas sp. TaxID=2022749 RepID=UPI0025D2F81F|nr:HEPN/Toprim-associated domain-containing protein [Sulfurimonas sp.]